MSHTQNRPHSWRELFGCHLASFQVVAEYMERIGRRRYEPDEFKVLVFGLGLDMEVRYVHLLHDRYTAIRPYKLGDNFAYQNEREMAFFWMMQCDHKGGESRD